MEEPKQSTTRTHQNKLGADGKKPGGTSGGVGGTHKFTSVSYPPTNVKQTTTTCHTEIEAHSRKDGLLPHGTGGGSGATHNELQLEGVAISITTTCTETIIEETKIQASSKPISLDGGHSGGTSGGSGGTHNL
ncbi:hypothetical protein QN277_002494 [Acacia crassicarpa]|uniref:Uncharacterized protein n=1 Tax=Acacia crassicarpa TaxID=499986 RepID=A0AAE1THZ1_9FABA|nr:hypothetical protein QN277_002494 [Acacia crassicarpa]